MEKKSKELKSWNFASIFRTLMYFNAIIDNILSTTKDNKENERALYHLAEAQKYLMESIVIAKSMILESDLFALDNHHFDVEDTTADDISMIISMTHNISESLLSTLKLNEIEFTKDVQDFFTELDNFEEELYDVI